MSLKLYIQFICCANRQLFFIKLITKKLTQVVTWNNKYNKGIIDNLLNSIQIFLRINFTFLIIVKATRSNLTKVYLPMDNYCY